MNTGIVWALAGALVADDRREHDIGHVACRCELSVRHAVLKSGIEELNLFEWKRRTGWIGKMAKQSCPEHRDHYHAGYADQRQAENDSPSATAGSR